MLGRKKKTVPFRIKGRVFEINKTKQTRSFQILLRKLRKSQSPLRLVCVGAGEIFQSQKPSPVAI